jgi:CDP-diacylglycerol--serine O-phosphatidyltransferase
MDMKFKRRRKKKERKKFRGVLLLPNLITTASLFGGFLAIVFAIEGKFLPAAWAIFVSLILDGLDGRIARMTQSTTSFGVQYDSLSDLVAFGVAPALLVYLWGLKPYGRFGWVAAFLFVTCGALRLARFNVQSGTMDPRYFNGLPIPAAAMVVATAIGFYYEIGEWAPKHNIYILIMMYVLAFLMVSNIKFFSLKKWDLMKRKPFQTLVTGVLLFVIIALAPQLTGFPFMLIYVSSGIISTLLYYRQPHPAPETPPEEETPAPKPSQP